MVEHRGVPHSVALVYRVIGQAHVFSSSGIIGLVHVGGHDLEKAFHSVIGALNEHVTAAYGCEAKYSCAMSYSRFLEHVNADNDMMGNFLEVTVGLSA